MREIENNVVLFPAIAKFSYPHHAEGLMAAFVAADPELMIAECINDPKLASRMQEQAVFSHRQLHDATSTQYILMLSYHIFSVCLRRPVQLHWTTTLY